MLIHHLWFTCETYTVFMHTCHNKSLLPQVLVLLQEQLCSPVVDSRAALVGPGKESRRTNVNQLKKGKDSSRYESEYSTCTSPVSHMVNTQNKLCWSSVATIRVFFGSRDTHDQQPFIYPDQFSSFPPWSLQYFHLIATQQKKHKHLGCSGQILSNTTRLLYEAPSLPSYGKSLLAVQNGKLLMWSMQLQEMFTLH